MILRRARTVTASMVLLGALAQAAPARAETAESEAAELLFEAGKKLMAEGRFAEACRELERSQELDPALGTLLNLADCYQRRGEGSRAYRTFVETRTLAAAGGHIEVERVADERASSLFAAHPKITIDATAASSEPDVQVLQDDVPVPPTFWGTPLPIEPGRHTFEARGPGRRPHRLTIEVVPGQGPARIEFPELGPLSGSDRDGDVRSPNSTSLKPRQWFAIGAGGAGAVGLVVGTIFGLKSIRVGHAADEHCDGSRCRTKEGVRLRSEARSAGDVSTVGFVLGAAGIATGAALWLTRTSESGAVARLGVSADRIELRYFW